jgi:hypothetical protein
MTVSNGAKEPPRSVTDLLRLQVYVLKLRDKLSELTACSSRAAKSISRFYRNLQSKYYLGNKSLKLVLLEPDGLAY